MANPLAQPERTPPSASDRSPAIRSPFPARSRPASGCCVVDDERTLRESCASVLQMDGYNVTLVGRGEEALETVKRRKFDIILVDLYMSQVSGLEILQAALEAYKDTIVVVMTGNPSVTSSIEALRAGRLGLPARSRSRATHLQVLIGRASHAVMMSREAQDLRRPAHEAARPQRQDRADRHLAAVPQGGRAGAQGGARPTPRCSSAARAGPARKSSPSSSTSTAGGRAEPLVPINCAALPEPLLESRDVRPPEGRLHRGRPRQARPARDRQRRDALPRRADRDVACRSRPSCCASFRTAWSGGSAASSRTPWWTCASSPPPTASRRRRWTPGVLRGDLFYRLRVVPIKLPPLRKRPEDIPLLANHFLTYYWQRHRQMGDRVPRLSEASIGFLRSRPWRGNVRELQNVIEHVAVLAEPDQMIQPDDIPVYDDGAEWPAESVAPPGVMRRGLPSRQGPGRGPVREGVPHPPRQPRRGQHVQGGAPGEHRPHHAVPADGQARIPRETRLRDRE